MCCCRSALLCVVVVAFFSESFAVADGPTGACCYLNAQCGESFTEPDCTGSGGIYQGNGTACAGGCSCVADINGGGDVDFSDLLAVLAAWGNAGGPEDLDGSGTVGARDLLLVISFQGPCGGTIFSLDIRPAPTVTFEDVSVEVGTPAGFVSWRAVAHLDPLDSMFAVAGPIDFSTDDPLGLANFGGIFTGMVEEDFPPDGPPFAELYDSFVTIGPTSGGLGLNIGFTPGFAGGVVPAIAGTGFTESEGAWFDAVPFAGPDVPIAQFTVAEGSALDFSGVIVRNTGQPGPRFDPFTASVAAPFVIQGAIDAATNGDAILIPPGVYNERLDLLGKAITLRPESGLVIVDGTGFPGPVITCDSGEGPTTVIEGLTITGGTGTVGDCLDGLFDVVGGGGMFVDGSSPTIRNCVFDFNRTVCLGGGLYLRASASVVEGCTFRLNDSSLIGGGLAAIRSEITLTDCTFFSNEAFLAGGLYLLESDCLMTDCEFQDNFSLPFAFIDSIWNQGRLIIAGENTVSPPGSERTGYAQFPLGTDNEELDSGVLVFLIDAAGATGLLTINARVRLEGELEVDYQGAATPPAETDVFFRFNPPPPSPGSTVEWELTDTLGLPEGLAAAPSFTPGAGMLTDVTMVLEPAGSDIAYAPPLPPETASGRTAAFDFANLNPLDAGEALDDFIVINGMDRLAVYLNSAAGFGPEVLLDTGGDPVDRFVVADFDCDVNGSLDIAAYQRRGAPSVHVLINDGFGNFTPLPGGPLEFPDPAAVGYDSVIAYDAEGDGDMDILGFRDDWDGASGNAFAVVAFNEAPVDGPGSCGNFGPGPFLERALCEDPLVCVRPFDGSMEINATLLDTASGQVDRAALYIKLLDEDPDEFAIMTVSGFDPAFRLIPVAGGIADGSQQEHAVSTDVNGDGNPDYVVATVVVTPIDASRGRIKVMDGGGSSGLVGGSRLNPDLDLDVGGVPFGIDVTDIDDDGDVDITVGFTPFGAAPGATVFRTFTGEPPRNSGFRLNQEPNDQPGVAGTQAFKFGSTLAGGPLEAMNLLCGSVAGEFEELVIAGNESTEYCPGDLDDDNFVGILDLIILLTEYDERGILGLLDVLSGWGPCPPVS